MLPRKNWIEWFIVSQNWVDNGQVWILGHFSWTKHSGLAVRSVCSFPLTNRSNLTIMMLKLGTRLAQMALTDKWSMRKVLRHNAGMMELVDIADLKSAFQQWECRFESGSRHSVRAQEIGNRTQETAKIVLALCTEKRYTDEILSTDI